jgi:cell division protein FtsB
MPSGPRPTLRSGAGPGRGRPRARSATRLPAEQARAVEDTADAAGSTGTEARSAAASRRSNLTTRAIALAVVLLVLTISYASSLRIYFAQTHGIAATQQQIIDSQNSITDLQAQLARWHDPAYVETQARMRLGWVMPGETGYRVVGDDGNPLGGGAEINSAAKKAAAPQDVWWAKMWGSVEAADKPAPAANVRPSKPPTITESTKPKDATPRR